MTRFGSLLDAQAQCSVAQARYSVAQARTPIVVAATDNGFPRPSMLVPRLPHRCPSPNGSAMRLRQPSGGLSNSRER